MGQDVHTHNSILNRIGADFEMIEVEVEVADSDWVALFVVGGLATHFFH